MLEQRLDDDTVVGFEKHLVQQMDFPLDALKDRSADLDTVLVAELRSELEISGCGHFLRC